MKISRGSVIYWWENSMQFVRCGSLFPSNSEKAVGKGSCIQWETYFNKWTFHHTGQRSSTQYASKIFVYLHITKKHITECMWHKHRNFKNTEWSGKQLGDILQTLRKDNHLSRWHSQRQVQDCCEWCFWSWPKCQMSFLNLDLPDLGIHMTIWSTIEMMEEKGPLIICRILPYGQYK